MTFVPKTLPLARYLGHNHSPFINRPFWTKNIQTFRKPHIANQCFFARNFASQAKSALENGKRKVSTRVLAFGVALGAAAGLGYSYLELKKHKIPIANNLGENKFLLLEAPPKATVARQIINDDDKSGLHLTLYQYQACPFCTKVRSYLDFAGVSYDVVEVNPVTKKQLMWSQYKKVPIVIASLKEGHQQLNDSSMIISALESYLKGSSRDLLQIVSYYPTVAFRENDGSERSEVLNRYFLMFGDQEITHRTKESIVEERRWRKWADDVLSHTLSPNIYRTWEEALEAFHLFSKNGDWERLFSSLERYLVIYTGAAVMYMIGRRLKKRHNLLDDVRESLYAEVNHFLRAIDRKSTPFMGGDEPDLSDLAVYAYLNSIDGTRAFEDLLSRTNVGPWYRGVQQIIAKRKGRVVIPSSD
nr:EOG090X08KD [Eulimnadia texana]